MKNKILFGNWEAVALLVNLICTKLFLDFPRTVAEQAGTASWILLLYISLLAFLGFFIISKLYEKFEGKDILDICQESFGQIGKIIIGIILLAFLIFITSIVLREYSEDMKIVAFIASPISFVNLFFLLTMIVGAYFGIEAIVRFHAVTVPIIVVGSIIIMVGVMPYADYTNVLPILGNGINEIFIKGFVKVSIYSEILILFLIVPYIKTNKNFKLVGYTSLGISTFFLTLSAYMFLAVRSYPTAIENFLPIYQLSRMINYGRFFQRIESLFLVMWVGAAMLYLSASFYFIVNIFKKMFNLEYYRPLIIPFAIIIFNLSLLPSNLIDAIKLHTQYFSNYSWIVTFLIIILVLIFARMASRKTKKGAGA